MLTSTALVSVKLRPRGVGPGSEKGDAGPHQADGVDLALERDAFAVEIVADPRAEPWMADQPVVEARRAAHEAGRREEQERRGRQHRQEDADHAQGLRLGNPRPGGYSAPRHERSGEFPLRHRGAP